MNTGTWLSLLKWFVDRLTWRLIAQLAVLTALGGTAYFTWESRGRLATMALDYVGQPAIQPRLLPQMIDGLVDELAPDSILVWSATPGRNTRRPLLVWVDGKQRPELEGRVEPLFPEDPSKVGLVVQILNGEVFCTDSTPWSPIAQVLTGDGVTWGCVVGIPPEETSLVGVIVVGFRDKREGEHMRIRLALKRWSRFVTGKDH
ncbi:hypothetical protein D3C84_728210 [compost metagenome]